MNSNILFAAGIGVVAGLRSLTAPAVVAWAANLGWINLHNSPLAFMGSKWTVVIFTALAVVELVADQLPSTPARTAANISTFAMRVKVRRSKAPPGAVNLPSD